MASLVNPENSKNLKNSENSETLNDRRNVAAYKFMLDMLNKGQKSGIYELTESKNLVESLIIVKCILEQSPDLPTEFEKSITECLNVIQNELLKSNNFMMELSNKLDKRLDNIERVLNNLTIEDP